MANCFQGIRPNVALNMAQDIERHDPKYDWLLQFQVSTKSFIFVCMDIIFIIALFYSYFFLHDGRSKNLKAR